MAKTFLKVQKRLFVSQRSGFPSTGSFTASKDRHNMERLSFVFKHRHITSISCTQCMDSMEYLVQLLLLFPLKYGSRIIYRESEEGTMTNVYGNEESIIANTICNGNA
ncbi:unnamed protein product [Absidia cylindrospora]